MFLRIGLYVFVTLFLVGCGGMVGARADLEGHELESDKGYYSYSKNSYSKTSVSVAIAQTGEESDLGEEELDFLEEDLLEELEEEGDVDSDEENAISGVLNRLSFDVFMVNYYVWIHPFMGVYNGIVPQFARDRVDDFAGTVRMPLTIVNDVLQGNSQGLGKSLSRTAKTIPTLGLYDFEREESLRRFEDYGQTLGVYGVPEGPFIMFPLAPTTRDAIAFAGRVTLLDPLKYLVDSTVSLAFLGTRMLSLFSNLDRALVSSFGSLNSEGAYAAARSAFLQQRQRSVEDRGQDEVQVEINKREGEFALDIDQSLKKIYEAG